MLNRELPGYPAVSLLGIYSGGLKTYLLKNLYTSVYGSIIHNGHKMEIVQISIDWTNEWNGVHEYDGILLAVEGSADTCYNMDELYT